jgi:hypothetical protein
VAQVAQRSATSLPGLSSTFHQISNCSTRPQFAI